MTADVSGYRGNCKISQWLILAKEPAHGEKVVEGKVITTKGFTYR